MKTRYVTYIIRIRLAGPEQGQLGSSGVQGTLQKAGAAQVQPFDNLDRLVDRLRKEIAGAEAEEPDATRIKKENGRCEE